jgi:hypothetical protein
MPPSVKNVLYGLKATVSDAKRGIFCFGKEIKGLRGGVQLVRRTSSPED